MAWTKEIIKDKLANDVRWMERGVLVLFNRQTEDEQNIEDTKYSNGVGFNGRDARYLTYVAKYLKNGGHLSGRHFDKVAKMLPKYWGQILEVIEEKERFER